MKNFNITLIACLAFIFLISSGCSKEEDSPYSREQIIGKWFYKSLWEMDNSGDGEWIDYPNFGKVYLQFNDDGTYYDELIQSNKSIWNLNGTSIVCRYYRNGQDREFDYYTYKIESINGNTLIVNCYYNDSPIPNKAKYIKQ